MLLNQLNRYAEHLKKNGSNKAFFRKTPSLLNALFRLFLLVSASYIILYPLFYMVCNSLKPQDQLLDPSIVWVPKSVTLDNFIIAAKAMNYWNSFGVSVKVDIVSAVIQVFTCAVIAYGFARFNFKGNKLLFALVMVTIIIPPQAIIVPLYLNFNHLDFLGILGFVYKITGKDLRPNLLNTALTFYIPSIFGVGLRSGLFIFIYRQFFKGMPKELEEAAWIDGAGPFKTFIKIVLPSSGVAILTVFLFSIIWHWNDFYLSSMYLSDNFPLAVSLSQIRSGLQNVTGYSEYGNPEQIRNLLMAGCLLFITPVLIMYVFLQKYFIKSIERVGIVG